MSDRITFLTIAFFALVSVVFSQTRELDSLALVALYEATDGDQWLGNNWLSDKPLHEWTGVTVKSDRVTELNLQARQLAGTIPEELTSLSQLEILNLSLNNLSGTLPDAIGNLSRLRTLNLEGNQLEGYIPDGCWKLSSIEVLRVHRNRLQGHIPSRWDDQKQASRTMYLPNLRVLTLSKNSFYGSIPGCLANCPLTTLALQFNRFSHIEEGITKLDIEQEDFTLAGNRLDRTPYRLREWLKNHASGMLNQESPRHVHVNPSAPDGGNGSNWENAYNCFQEALAAAESGDEILLAAGVYTPDDGSADPTMCFDLKPMCAIVGGYNIVEGEYIGYRDPKRYPTILSGDIGVRNEDYDNSQRIMTLSHGSRLEGLTISSAGSSQLPTKWGAGVYAQRGDGIVIKDCIFSENHALSYGGGIAAADCHFLTVDRCIFTNNHASGYNDESPKAGAIALLNSNIQLTNSLFYDNSDGAVWISFDEEHYYPAEKQLFYNNTFVNNGVPNLNTENQKGGCLTAFGSSNGMDIHISNCILWNSGTAAYTERCFLKASHSITLTPSDPFIQSNPNVGSVNLEAISHEDPLFVDSTLADFRILISSPAVNLGNGTTDTTGWGWDLARKPRVLDYRIDIGAFEFLENRRYFVNHAATGTGRGTSWQNAFTDMQTAFDHSFDGDTICVAKGKYYCGSEVTAALTLLGGFRGDESSLDQRNWTAFPCTLSADPHNNDYVEIITDFYSGTEHTIERLANQADNSNFVVNWNIPGTRLPGKVTIDGFTIIGSNGFGIGSEKYEIDMHVRNCSFEHHLTGVSASELLALDIANSSFNWNNTHIDCYPAHVVQIRDCEFKNSDDYSIQSGVYSKLTIDRCTFSDTLYTSWVPQAVMIESYADPERPDVEISNSLFLPQKDIDGSGYLDAQGCKVSLKNCTVADLNSTDNPGWGLSVGADADVHITNSVFWSLNGSGVQPITNDFGLLAVGYSNLQGSGGSGSDWDIETYGEDGGGNIDSDPQFSLESPHPFAPATSRSPLVDAGSPGSSAEETDLAGLPRINNGVVDIGAYEYSGPYEGSPIVPLISSTQSDCRGGYIASFGYRNPNSASVSIPVGDENSFNAAQDVGQTTLFHPGEHHDAFTVPFTSTPPVWNLNGLSAAADPQSVVSNCKKPVILPPLLSAEATPGRTITINLSDTGPDGNGIYARDSYYPVDELDWGFSDFPEAVKVVYFPETKVLAIEVDETVSPGTTIPITARVVNPAEPGLYDQQEIALAVVSGGFDIRNLTLEQDEAGKFTGTFESRRNASSISFSQGRLHIFEKQITDGSYNRDEMSFLNGLAVTELRKPRSSGGVTEYGLYSFEFYGASEMVYNRFSEETGLSLRDWAVENPVFNSSGELTFLLTMTTEYDPAQFYTVSTRPDFSGPAADDFEVVYFDSTLVELAWQPFTVTDKVSSLELRIIPRGENAPEIQTINLTDMLPEIRYYRAENLQDHRLYDFALVGTDTRGNRAAVATSVRTLSSPYFISGSVSGKLDPTEVRVHLFELDPSAEKRPFTPDKTEIEVYPVEPDGTYKFEDLSTAKSYSIIPFHETFSSTPAGRLITIDRDNVTNTHFTMSPDPLCAIDGVRVKQLENSGNLQIIAGVSPISADEELYAVRLSWEQGWPGEIVSDSELFDITEYVEKEEGEKLQWVIEIPRSRIREKILSRTDSFNRNVRYVNAELLTRTESFEPFRISQWNYPHTENNTVLFAPQYFVTPPKPALSPIQTGTNGAVMRVASTDPGPGVQISAEIYRAGRDIPSTKFVSGGFDYVGYGRIEFGKGLAESIVFFPNWNYAQTSTEDADGVQYLTGYMDEPEGPVPHGTFYPPPEDQLKFWNERKARIRFPVRVLRSAPSDGYSVWVLTDRVSEYAELYVGANGLSPVDGQRFVIRIPENEGAGWHRAHQERGNRGECAGTGLYLSRGYNTLDIYSGSPDVSIIAVALSSSCEFTPPNQDAAERMEPRVNRLEFTGLVPDTDYRMEVRHRDRFGNTSDPLVVPFRTKDVHFLENVVASQEPETGDLLLHCKFGGKDLQSIAPGSYLDSIALKVDGHEGRFALDLEDIAIDEGNPVKEIRLPRDSLSDLLGLENFLRRAEYVNSELIIAKDTIDTSYTCTRTVETKKVKRFLFWKIKTIITRAAYVETGQCAAGCVHGSTISCNEEMTTVDLSTKEPHYFQWPGTTTADLVSSQQYNSPKTPVTEAALKEPFRIVLDTIRMNDAPETSAPLEQMAGNLRVRWLPGSLCDDSTVVNVPFANRFSTDTEGWIAFKPSFEAAVTTEVGNWLNQAPEDGRGARHQWLDKYNPAATAHEFGGFQPNTGDDLSILQIKAEPTAAPRISMGIRLESFEASANATPEELFTLWVLPDENNGENSNEFYWGIDNDLSTVEPGSADPAHGEAGFGTWVRGPSVLLTEGDHTVDLYMKEDGTNILGIALHKGTAIPSFTHEQLPTWGDKGYAVGIVADKLESETKYEFNLQATDRYGNVSKPFTYEVTTPRAGERIPRLIIEPEDDVTAGYFSTPQPVFRIFLESPYGGELIDPEVILYKRNGEVSETVEGFYETTSEGDHIWKLTASADKNLVDHPTESALDPSHAYLLAVRPATAKSSGDWTYYTFGVKAGFEPEGYALEDSVFTIGTVTFRYLHGVESDGAVTGDMVVEFQSEAGVDPLTALILEGTTITVEDRRITDVNGGHFKAVEYRDFQYTNVSVPDFSLATGKFFAYASPESIRLDKIKGVLTAEMIHIADDNGHRCRMSMSYPEYTPVSFDSYGLTSSFWVPNDNFVMRDVVDPVPAADGFSIKSCVTRFAKLNENYVILAAGKCPECAPFVIFNVKKPSSGGIAFFAHDALDRTATITYTDEDPSYKLDFREGPFKVAESSIKECQYDNWTLSVNAYDLDDRGVHLTDIDVELNHEIFPLKAENGQIVTNAEGRRVPRVSGLRITGKHGVDRGALHLYGEGTASETHNLVFTTQDDYDILDVPSYTFRDDGAPDGRDFILVANGDTKKLRAPARKQRVFAFSAPRREGEDIVLILEKCILQSHGFKEAVTRAEEFTAYHPWVDLDNEVAPSGGLRLSGSMIIRREARVFDITTTTPENSVATILNGRFENTDGNIAVPKSEVVFRGNFSLHSISGRYFFEGGEFPDAYIVPEDARWSEFTTKSLLLEQMGDSVVMRFDMPRIRIRGMGTFLPGASTETFGGEVHSALFDFYGKPVHAAGYVPLPADMQCVGHIPEVGTVVADKFGNLCLNGIGLEYNRSGFNRESEIIVGGSAKLRLGEYFKVLGLQNEIIDIENYDVSLTPTTTSLRTLRASALPTPKKIGISLSDVTLGAIADKKPMIELATSGSGLAVDYERERQDQGVELNMRNWSLAATDNFPIVGLRGLTFHIDRLTYRDGRVTDLQTRVSHYLDSVELFDGVKIYGVGVKIGYLGSDKTVPADQTDSKLNAYFSMTFEGFRIGEELIDTRCPGTPSNIQVYFDGKIGGTFCYRYKKPIPIYPLTGDPANPDKQCVYFNPITQQGDDEAYIQMEASFEISEGNSSFRAGISHTEIRSTRELPPNDKRLHITDFVAKVGVNKGNIEIIELAGGYNIEYSKDVGPFTMHLDRISVGVVDDFTRVPFSSAEGQPYDPGVQDKIFFLNIEGGAFFTAGDDLRGCNADIKSDVGFIMNLHQERDLKITWNLGGKVACRIANGIGIDAREVTISDTRVEIGTAMLDMSGLSGVLKRDANNPAGNQAKQRAVNVGITAAEWGVVLEHFTWEKQSNGEWKFLKDRTRVTPLFSTRIRVDIAGNEVSARADFTQLFATESPGLYFDDLVVTMNDKLGGGKIPTGFGIRVDGEAPFIHPRPGMPGKLSFAIPSLKLTDEIKLGDCLMEIGVETYTYPDQPWVDDDKVGTTYEEWYCRGKATMSLPGAIEEMTVDLALVKPDPWENVTGIKHAKLTIKLSQSCRIPLGSTPFYISGFFGAMYDGLGQPEGAVECNIGKLPPGLKFEAKIFLEFKEPSVAQADVGFWVQLTELNFGINGNVKALEGLVNANACAALYNGGRNFHTHLQVYVSIKINVKGEFVVDIWQDNSGANMSGEANASIQVPRAMIVDRRFIKIPRKNLWFNLFTQFGKFTTNQKGFLTGVRFIGRKFGVGIIGRRFRLGNLSNHKLKRPNFQAAALGKMGAFASTEAIGDDVDAPTFGLAEAAESYSRDRYSTGIVLSGGELITVLAAKSTELNNDFDWTDQDLRLHMGRDGAVRPVPDHYMSMDNYRSQLAEFEEDEAAAESDQALNFLSRSWANRDNDKGTVYITLPEPVPGKVDFEYELHAGLIEPDFSDLYAELTDNEGVRIVGDIQNFQKDIKTLTMRYDGRDTLIMKQKNRLKLYYRPLLSRGYSANPSKTRGSFTEIPLEQLEGDIVYDEQSRVLSLDAVWPFKNGVPEELEFAVDVETVDFLNLSGDGGITALPDDEEEYAMVFRNMPHLLTRESGAELTVEITEDMLPEVKQPLDVTATGSRTRSNFEDDDESRTLFLRWKNQPTPRLAGYLVEWRSALREDAPMYHQKIHPSEGYRLVFQRADDAYTTDYTYAEGDGDIVYERQPEYTEQQVLLYTKEEIRLVEKTVDGEAVDVWDTVKTPVYRTVRTPLHGGEYTYNTTRPALGVPDGAIYEPETKDTVVYDEGEPRTITKTTYKLKSVKFDDAMFDTLVHVYITPLTEEIVHEKVDDYGGWSDEEGKVVKYSDSFTRRRKRFVPVPEEKITLENVSLGRHSPGTNDIEDDGRNTFTLNYFNENGPLENDKVVDVPLGTEVKLGVDLTVSDYNPEGIHPANYAELRSAVRGIENDDTVDFVEQRLPQVGALDNFFAVDAERDSFSLAIWPRQRDVHCRDLFDSPCRSCVDETAETISEKAGVARDSVVFGSFCNGRPDSLVTGRSPFGTYEVTTYAINNGYRDAEPIHEGPAHVATRSFRFRLTPPRPVLHQVVESYLISGRGGQALHILVSDLWDMYDEDTELGGDPGPRLRIFGDEGEELAEFADTLLSWNEIEDPLDTVAAEYVISDTFYLAEGYTGSRFHFVLENRHRLTDGTVISTASDTFRIDNIFNVDDIGCREFAITSDDDDMPNYRWAMDFIGYYPERPSPGQTVTALFTNILDLDESLYSIYVAAPGIPQEQSTAIENYDVYEHGIEFEVPGTVAPEIPYEFVVALSEDFGMGSCPRQRYRDTLSITSKREYSLNLEQNGFSVTLGEEGNPEDVVLDKITYILGLKEQINTLPELSYKPLNSSKLGHVETIPYSSWVTVVVRDEIENITQTRSEFVLVNTPSELTDGSETPLEDSPDLTPGQNIQLPEPTGPDEHDQNRPETFYSIEFGDGRIWYGNGDSTTYVVQPGDECPIILKRHELIDSDTVTSIVKVYDCSILPRTPGDRITIPSANLMAAATEPIEGYPLLLRLDETHTESWETIQTEGLHVRSLDGAVLPHQIEWVDWNRRRMDLWVKVDRIDPDLGNAAVELAPGAPPAATDESDVWSDRYRAVWHCTETPDGGLADATENGYTADDPYGEPVSPAIAGAGRTYGSHEAVVVSKGPGTYADGGVTLSTWVRFDELRAGESSRLLSRGNAAVLRVTGDGRIVWRIGTDSLVTPPAVIETNTWLYIAGAYANRAEETEDGYASVWVNGIRVARGLLNNDNPVPYASDDSFVVGDAHGFSGTLDEARMSPMALSGDRLRLDYYSQRPANDFLTTPAGYRSIALRNAATGVEVVNNWQHDSLCFKGAEFATLFDVPERLAGSGLVRVSPAARLSTEDTLVTIELSGPVTLYLAVDNASDPITVADWEQWNERCAIRSTRGDREIVAYRMYRREVTGADTIVLPGPAAGLGAHEQTLAPMLFVQGLSPRPSVPVALHGPEQSRILAHADSESFLFPDREYRLTRLPDALRGAVLVSPPNAFKGNEDAGFVEFSSNRPTKMGLLWDSSSPRPPFLKTGLWLKSSETVEIDNGTASLELYETRREAGRHVLPGSSRETNISQRFGYTLFLRPDTARSIATTEPIALDTAVQVYPDTNWTITALSDYLRRCSLVPIVRQSEYRSVADSMTVLRLKRSAWVFVALDERQRILPSFMEFDGAGGWERTEYTLRTDAPGSYVIYRKFVTRGELVISGPRSGGETGNQFNLMVFIDPEPVNGKIVVHAPEGLEPKVFSPEKPLFTDGSGVPEANPIYLDQSYVITVPPFVNECDTTLIEIETRAALRIAVDAEYDESRLPYTADGWTRTGEMISMAGDRSPLEIWEKEVAPGLIRIPGIRCGGLTGRIRNTPIFIELYGPAYHGLYAEDVRVRGFGDRRKAWSASWRIGDLDIAYAVAHNLSSPSWRMDVRSHGGTREQDDTLRVLKLVRDSIVYRSDITAGDTIVVKTDTVWALSDLLPVLISADSVSVDAHTLASEGTVRLIFMNRGSRDIDHSFGVILFEDVDGDYRYDHGVDRNLGHVFVESIDGNEFLEYEIALTEDLSFPEQAIFAFVDRFDWVPELSEENNVLATDGPCRDFAPGYYEIEYAWETDEFLNRLVPYGAVTTVGLLRDTDGDSVITEDDNPVLMYVSEARLWAVDVVTYDTLIRGVGIQTDDEIALRLVDLTGNLLPEVIAGNMVFSTKGDTLWSVRAGIPGETTFFDIDGDNRVDRIVEDGGTVVVRNADDEPILAYPLNQWTGEPTERTVGVLALVAPAEPLCFDLSASLPRIAPVGADSIDITIRIANAGAARIDSAAAVRVTLMDEAETVLKGHDIYVPTALEPGEYFDCTARIPTVEAISVIRFTADPENRYFETDEKNNHIAVSYD